MNQIPTINEVSYYKYKNPIEVKYTFDEINSLPPELKNYFYYLSTAEIINVIRSITQIHTETNDSIKSKNIIVSTKLRSSTIVFIIF